MTKRIVALYECSKQVSGAMDIIMVINSQCIMRVLQNCIYNKVVGHYFANIL